MSCLLELCRKMRQKQRNCDEREFSAIYMYQHTKKNKEKKVAMHTILKVNKQEKNKCVRKTEISIKGETKYQLICILSTDHHGYDCQSQIIFKDSQSNFFIKTNLNIKYLFLNLYLILEATLSQKIFVSLYSAFPQEFEHARRKKIIVHLNLENIFQASQKSHHSFLY